MRWSTTTSVAYDSSVSMTAAFGAQTYAIRLCATSACHVAIGDGAQTATSNSPFLPANWVDEVIVTPGQRIAAIKSPTNGLVTSTAGTLWVTELT